VKTITSRKAGSEKPGNGKINRLRDAIFHVLTAVTQIKKTDEGVLS